MEKQGHSKTIGLIFPYSTCENEENPKYKIEYNVALKSGFLEAMLDYDENDSDEIDDYIEFVIPRDLYKGIRRREIDILIGWWSGKKTWFGVFENEDCCIEDIARLSQSLLLSRSIPFVRELEIKYPPNEVREYIISQKLSHDEEIHKLHTEIAHLRAQIHNIIDNFEVPPLPPVTPPSSSPIPFFTPPDM